MQTTSLQSDIQSPTRIFSPAEPAPFLAHRQVNFDPEVLYVLGLAEKAAKAQQNLSVLAFGYPGNGKRAFAQRVASELYEKGCSVVWVDIAALSSVRAERVKQAVSDVRQRLEDRDSRPLLMVVNGLDSLPGYIVTNKDLSALVSLLETEWEAPVYTMVTATSPTIVLPLLHPPVQLMYFSWPDEERAAHLLETVGVPRSREVTSKLFLVAKQRRVRYSTGSLVNGARQALRIAALEGGPERLTAEKCAEVALAVCTPTSDADAREYELQYAAVVEEAKRVAEERDALAQETFSES